MKKQVLVIQYVGEKPTPQEAAAAIVAMQRAGTYIDTTVEPTMCHLTEKEQGMAALMFANKKESKGKGITVKVESGEPFFESKDKDRADRFIAALKDFMNG